MISHCFAIIIRGEFHRVRLIYTIHYYYYSPQVYKQNYVAECNFRRSEIILWKNITHSVNIWSFHFRVYVLQL
jgi:hypothetical protein